ncbi:3-methyladenine DNA glycosylase AlkD [Sphingobacterium allocomposti]|uniref:3-methyladenine DNA glycosylase AlkD n=1 Tax=Sphingobacterium allocomposti TaxID=415956 RepID=A0A5S5DMS5_9SPHI|nr:DNA alkylation repair protein [Sphingobacterium composti Yoo et al. 2007 non Ten et al. 2007]TYP97240.1 3-methyladenine DNA glycosylase AlkD [Sphingobacterium composti Yoo et al. 2007 non Ten et al. 2007]
MQHSSQAESILAQINTETKLGDLRKIAAQIKKNHELALELWSTGQFLPRQLAILIMDKKQLSQELIDKLDNDIAQHVEDERLQLADWLMANQLSKDKHTIALMETWENRQSPLQRRIYWYYQARLRWVGQKPSNSEELLAKIESRIEGEVQEVQWAMNFTAGWIGVYERKYRSRCIALGEKTGLYKDEMVSKGCTPNYLPEFIAIESSKRNI